MLENWSPTIYVDLLHVAKYSAELLQCILDNYLRLEPLLKTSCETLFRELVAEPLKELCEKVCQDMGPTGRYDLIEHICKRMNVVFCNVNVADPVLRLRDMRSEHIGRLVNVEGFVTHSSQPMVELIEGAFQCGKCVQVINVQQHFQFTEPKCCTDILCKNTTQWLLLRDRSMFVDLQIFKVQELCEQTPIGSLARSIKVIVLRENVEQTRPGDKIKLTGTLVALPDRSALASVGERSEYRREGSSQAPSEGLRGVKASRVLDVSYRLAFLANSVQISDGTTYRSNRKREGVAEKDEAEKHDCRRFTEHELKEIQRIRNTPDFFNKLLDSVAPTVFGHHDVKRAVLVMAIGGVRKRTEEGMNLRGNINVCIVGDPGCAKSKLLKYACDLVPRSVYISGTSSSAAGLTAAVVKDKETGEFCVEAGALILADNGICCIDEFDKMDRKVQVALDEAMEQQTISITKAGIQATLNARTSILAAANPAGGRYDKTKPLKYNVALPPEILSRFDLVYVMIDDPDDLIDSHIAHHIVRVRQKREEALSPTFTTAELKLYIAYAKTLQPELTSEARKLLVASYVSLRRRDAVPGTRLAYRMTVRQLEALIRLSEAIARSHLDAKVLPCHVTVAVRLLKTSVVSVESSEIDLSEFVEESNVGGAGGSERHQAKQFQKLVVKEEYFEIVTQALVILLRQAEENAKKDGKGLLLLKQKDLITKYGERQHQNERFRSAEEIVSEVRTIKAIIQRLINVEGYLIVVHDGSQDADGTEDAAAPQASVSRDERILALAPHYVID